MYQVAENPCAGVPTIDIRVGISRPSEYLKLSANMILFWKNSLPGKSSEGLGINKTQVCRMDGWFGQGAYPSEAFLGPFRALFSRPADFDPYAFCKAM